MADEQVATVDAEAERSTALAPLDVNLAVEQQREAGLNALARLTETQFFERMQSLRVGLERFDLMMREVLEPGVDLMHIEGVPKPVFTLSAAEKTCFVARLAPTFHVERVLGTPPETPAIHYVVRCDLHLGNTDGPTVAQGVGSANSHEKKYRWRTAEKFCPSCGVVGALVKSKFKAKAGTEFAGTLPYFCWKKKGGCGAEFAESDTRITTQKGGMVDNPDIYDLDNTLLKMSKKRAFVDATKTATCASGRVTQDLEDGTPQTDEAVRLRDAIVTAAAAAKFKTRGDLWAVVKKSTNKVVTNMDEFAKLTANELAKVYDAMPKPVAASDAHETLDMPANAERHVEDHLAGGLGEERSYE